MLWVQSLGREDPLEKEMATHSSILVWKIPWADMPGRLLSVHGVTKSRTRLSNFTLLHFLVPMVKNSPANAGDIRDVGSVPGLRRSPGGGHGNPFQYSCLENPMGRGTCWATVHRVAKSWTWLSNWAQAQILKNNYRLCLIIVKSFQNHDLYH